MNEVLKLQPGEIKKPLINSSFSDQVNWSSRDNKTTAGYRGVV